MFLGVSLGRGSFFRLVRGCSSISNLRKGGIQDVELIRSTRNSNPYHNIPVHIENRIGANLHLKRNHPLNTISHLITDYFSTFYIDAQRQKLSSLSLPLSVEFKPLIWDDLSPIVTVEQNFDQLLIPADHVSRSPSDTYYLSQHQLLRCHTSAHQNEIMKLKDPFFFIIGDVYRRDTIDLTHFPIFHQMEGVRIFEPHPEIGTEFVVADLKEALEGLTRSLFGDIPIRWVEAYFPFTNSSMEMEIYFDDEWIEVLGCGVVRPEILRNAGNPEKIAWAFGLGLERLAMILFGIKDIRLFWSEDHRFISQFEQGKVVRFKPFSKQPACYKDITFWVDMKFCENEFYEIVRAVGGDIVEEVKLIDRYEHPQTRKVSFCYRINYRAMDKTLVNCEIDEIQEKLRNTLFQNLDIELR